MTDRMAIKHPQAWTRKQFRQMGLSAANGKQGRGEARFVADSGHAFVIPTALSASGAIMLVSNARVALGMSRSIVLEKTSKPTLTRGQVRLSVHARERLALMRVEGAISMVEIDAAMFTPSEVVYSDKYGSWLFITGRLKVAVAIPDDDLPTVKTVMWSHEELFAKYPRPGVRV